MIKIVYLNQLGVIYSHRHPLCYWSTLQSIHYMYHWKTLTCSYLIFNKMPFYVSVLTLSCLSISTSAACQGSFREVRNEVSKQCYDAGRPPRAPLSPSLHTAHSPQLMAQPCHYTQPRLRKAVRSLPALAKIRPWDSARYFTAVQNIWARDQYEAAIEGCRACCHGVYVMESVIFCLLSKIS